MRPRDGAERLAGHAPGTGRASRTADLALPALLGRSARRARTPARRALSLVGLTAATGAPVCSSIWADQTALASARARPQPVLGFMCPTSFCASCFLLMNRSRVSEAQHLITHLHRGPTMAMPPRSLCGRPHGTQGDRAPATGQRPRWTSMGGRRSLTLTCASKEATHSMHGWSS